MFYSMIDLMRDDKKEVVLSRKAYLSIGIRSILSKMGGMMGERVMGEGVNLVLEIFVVGPISAKSDLVINLSELDLFLKSIVEKYDHKNFVMEPTQIARDIWLQCLNLWDHPIVRIDRLKVTWGDSSQIEFAVT